MRQLNLRSLDLNLLVLLDLLIDQRSVTRAAEEANMSQPAMSRALGRLRALLGDPILVRGSEALVPTPRALALQPALKRALGEITGLVAPTSFDPAGWDGRLVVSATDHQTIMLLPALMARLAREAPRLDVTVVPFGVPVLDDLRDGRVHLAFGIAERPLGPGLRMLPLFGDAFVTLLRGGHPAAEEWTAERFAGLDHVLVTVLGEGRGILDDELASLGLARRVALRLPHFYAAIAVVAQTDLVVTLPRTIARLYTRQFGLLALAPPLASAPFTHTLIWSEVLDADPAIRWLRSIVAEVAGRIEA